MDRLDERSCENCGNYRCKYSLVAFWWDECVESDFTKHWIPEIECTCEEAEAKLKEMESNDRDS